MKRRDIIPNRRDVRKSLASERTIITCCVSVDIGKRCGTILNSMSFAISISSAFLYFFSYLNPCYVQVFPQQFDNQMKQLAFIYTNRVS